MAVYTDVADDELRAFVALYDIGEVLSCKGIAEGVENSNFLVATERGNFILTLYEKRVAREDLPFFIALMEHLAHRGVACPTPLRGRDGDRPARTVRPPGGDGDLSRRHVAAPHPAVPLRRRRPGAGRIAQRRDRFSDGSGERSFGRGLAAAVRSLPRTRRRGAAGTRRRTCRRAVIARSGAGRATCRSG